jgi:hypothetical protein
VIAIAVDDTAWARELNEQFLRTQKDAIRMLWNGRFFAYGCEIDGSKRVDSILFTGQLAGQFITRYCGWGDIYPQQVIKASLVSQFKISLSASPDYYANKVWDISLGKGIDQRGSQCWPFYLESYTAYPALETGYVDDGMDIMKHIQLVHLRKGLTWSQNLWNPGDITYMTAPVTWFSTDVLAGAGINVITGEIRLAPLNLKQAVSVYPLYYPKFWATLQVDHTKRKVVLKVSKHFGEPVIFHTMKIQQAGKSGSEEKVFGIDKFKAESGSEIDLSRYYNELTTQEIAGAVLPHPDRVPFKIFKPF